MVSEWTNWLSPWWPTVGAFFAMGKHGFYVWASVGVCALALALEQVLLARHIRRWQRDQALIEDENNDKKMPPPLYPYDSSATKVKA